MQLGDLGARRHAQLGVEVAERLVHQEDARVAHHGARQCHALALAAGELARLAVEEGLNLQRFGGAADVARDRAGGGAGDGMQAADQWQALPRPRPAHQERQADIFGHRHIGVEGVGLEHHRHVAFARQQAVDRLVAEGDRALVGMVEAGDDAQQGGLAAA